MFFSVEMADLLLYCIQQLGVMLAVGAESIVLVAYIVSIRDGRVDESEIKFLRAVRRALAVGLAGIIFSGAVITILHSTLGQADIIFSPAFLFKWFLILILSGAYFWQHKKAFSHPLFEGAVGGTWYALFLVHILAPITTWFDLVLAYAFFLVVFVAIWGGIVALMKPHMKVSVEKPTPKVVPPPAPKIVAPPPPPPPKPVPPSPPPPKPIPVPVPPPPIPVVAAVPAVITPPPPPPPAIIQKPLPVVDPPPVPPPPVEDPHHSFWLPAIHIMPKTQAELDNKTHLMPLGAISPNS